MTQLLYQTLHAGKFTAIVALDLQKTFDTSNKKMLLFNIKAMGINSEWFSSYRFQNSQMTKIGDSLSNFETTKSGVPQGSILDTYLFSIFINNMAKVMY